MGWLLIAPSPPLMPICIGISITVFFDIKESLEMKTKILYSSDLVFYFLTFLFMNNYISGGDDSVTLVPKVVLNSEHYKKDLLDNLKQLYHETFIHL